MQGLQRALEAGADEVSIFAAASESFSRRNINCSIADSLKRFEEVAEAAKEARVRVRGYVSCVIGCPYEVCVQYLYLSAPSHSVDRGTLVTLSPWICHACASMPVA